LVLIVVPDNEQIIIMKGSIVSLTYIMINVQVFQSLQLLHIPLIVVLFHIHSHITSIVCCRHNMGPPITNEPPITSNQINLTAANHLLITRNQQHC
jgi:hypothetical protein